MHFFRLHLSRFVRMACWLILAAACVPTVAKLVVASDPLSARTLTEVCSTDPAKRLGSPASQPLGTLADASAHCPLCVTPGLPVSLPPPDRRADFTPAPHRLRPVTEPLATPKPAPVWRQLPPRAPPLA